MSSVEPVGADITINHISKTFSVSATKSLIKAVNDISLHILKGEFVTLLGPSGCGKTTTLRIIAGFEAADSGEVLVDGKPISNMLPNKRDLGMVFQDYALFPHMSVFDNVAYGLKQRKVPKKDIKDRVTEVLKLVGLEGFGNRSPSQLSGGQQQRVALARAIVIKPRVLLFDEPLSNLDAKLRVTMRSELRKLQQRLGITAIYVTHDQGEAMSMSDRIVVMNQGMILQVGTPQEIYRYPRERFVAGFIGKVNLFPARVTKVDSNSANINIVGVEFIVPRTNEAIHESDDVLAVVRPESFRMFPEDEAGLKGNIKDRVYLGSVVEYTVALADRDVIVMQYDPGKLHDIQENVSLTVPTGNIHLMPAS